MPWFFYLSRALLRVFFMVFTRLKINGRENIVPDRPLVVVANHITFAEPPLVGILLKGKVRFATKEGFFRNIFARKMMEGLGCFPVHQGRPDRNTIRLMEQFVKDGFALVIFPEGTRSLKAELLPAFNGAALMAERTGALILPVGFSGTEKLRRPGWYFKRPQITVNFGQPFHLPVNSGKLPREEATEFIMGRITHLLQAEYHGVYAEKENLPKEKVDK